MLGVASISDVVDVVDQAEVIVIDRRDVVVKYGISSSLVLGDIAEELICVSTAEVATTDVLVKVTDGTSDIS